jgi:hypothetical protein
MRQAWSHCYHFFAVLNPGPCTCSTSVLPLNYIPSPCFVCLFVFVFMRQGLTMWPKMASNIILLPLPPKSGIISICYHAQHNIPLAYNIQLGKVRLNITLGGLWILACSLQVQPCLVLRMYRWISYFCSYNALSTWESRESN